MVRSNGPVSGPDDRCVARSRSASSAGRVQAGHRGADAILDPVQGVVVEPARQAGQQFGECGGQQFQKLRRIDADLADRPRRQHQE